MTVITSSNKKWNKLTRKWNREICSPTFLESRARIPCHQYLDTASNHYRIVGLWLFFRPKMRQFEEALTGPFLYELKVTV